MSTNTVATGNAFSVFTAMGPCNTSTRATCPSGIWVPPMAGTSTSFSFSTSSRSSRGYRTLTAYRSLPSTVIAAVIPPTVAMMASWMSPTFRP